MKRSKGDLSSNPKVSVDFPAKAQRRPKDSSPKTPGARSKPPATAPEKLYLPSRGLLEESRPADTVLDALAPPEAPALDVDEVAAVWDLSWGPELGGWWWWGVEEDKLSGWFPFEVEDFIIGGGARGGGVLWEEEDHDIWQLQEINEIPTTAK